MIKNAFSNYENACALAMFNQRHGLKHTPSHQQDKSGQFTWSRAQKTATDVFGKQRESIDFQVFMFIRETGGIVFVAVFHTRNREKEKT